MKNRRSHIMEHNSNSGDSAFKQYVPVKDFEFHGLLEEEDSNNGLFFNGTFIPEEILIEILSFIPPKQLLHLSLVCKKWCNIIKSESLWINIYNNDYPHQAKLLPWYVYYLYYSNSDNFKNLLKNGNGKEGFDHWIIIKNLGDEFRIEDPPSGSDPLPEGVDDFNGHTSCFATSYYECNKIQEIRLKKKRLLRYVMNKYKPHIYVSEWVAGRFDCGCEYKLVIRGFWSEYAPRRSEYMEEAEYENEVFPPKEKRVRIEQWAGKVWEKVEVLIEDYPKDLMTLVFEHEGNDTQFWKGHYGSKMAGGVVRFLFDTIKPEKKEN